jgi:tetratricopeptide (TPR) repeat protein
MGLEKIMSENLKLHYCTPGLGPGEVIYFKEFETELLACLQDSWGECQITLWNLVRFCRSTGQQERAVGFVERLLELSDNSDQRAHCFLALAMLSEEMEDYDSAKAYYEEVFELEELEDNTLYFVHNNFGYLLNQLGQFEEAEPHLERAISIDPELANGYKNLGLACEGLGRLEEAIECYITATQVEPYDARSLVHLENLLSTHPELFVRVPYLQRRMEWCREGVEIAQSDLPEVTVH